ncbi:hypothetical protein DUNSADRAFT_12456 [Dunaliella salina]|uniref:Encoded protein n=1 Tax=Dunaliella salina TaxID=3046 RepID=A0ABQ7H3W3_DUNSA|nr:hypothetical protein DUNSADRAFT_12456 [Dunaliella salina]|eukprot:KAF5841528.1 hypothetical protein DUNSADRAFT_12456 [Dunaliella salina]
MMSSNKASPVIPSRSHALDLALPTPASCGQLRQQLQDLGEEACQAISCAVAVVADSTHSTGSGSSPPITIPPESAPLMECIPPSPASPTPPASGAQVHVTSSSADRQPSQTSPSSTPVLPITLFTPVGIRSSTASATRVDGASEGGKGEGRKEAWASLEVVGTVGGQARLQGTVQGVVYCHQRETFGRSVVALKGQSLVLCDYLLPGEGIEAAAERAAELLSPPTASCSVASQASHLQADASPILILEAPSTSITAKQLPPWQPQDAHAAPVVPGKPAAVQAATMNGGNHARSWACKGGGAAVAAGVAVVGVTLGWVLVYSSS